jgi:ribosomal protein S12 methylthiotransferase
LTLSSRGAPGGRRAGTVALISLGCAKNLVDSEVMLGALKKAGYVPTGRAEDADLVIVNTCGFIQPARAEAEDALREVAGLKRRDPAKRIVAAGCYVERSRDRLASEFPEVDVWAGVRDFDRIAELVQGRSMRPRRRTFLCSDTTPRLVSTPGTWAYVKVSEGCSHRCGFCAIPLIKGPYVSRRPASVVREARALADQGVKEIDLISHDTTWFGRDRGHANGLARLLGSLSRIEDLAWVRFLYGYPEEVDDALLEAMAHPRICRYLDLPFQHADPRLIRSMKRGLDGARALRLLERIRTKLPGVAVRTSLIVGFPGEGRKEFAALKRFVAAARFDHLGVFAFSPEEGTPAARLAETVSPEEKEDRREEVMELQARLSRRANAARVGQVIEVLVEGPEKGRAGFWTGRGRFQAPEVDGIVRFAPGAAGAEPEAAVVRVKIDSAGDYDLTGRLVP